MAYITAVGDVRHLDVMRRAEMAVVRAIRSLDDGMGPECAAADVNDSLDALGEVTGRITSQELLERIFERFCVGK